MSDRSPEALSRMITHTFQHIHSCVAQFDVVENDGKPRRDEPVCVGIPIADGVPANTGWTLLDAEGNPRSCTWEILSSWPSGCPKWIRLTMVLDAQAGARQVYNAAPTDSSGANSAFRETDPTWAIDDTNGITLLPIQGDTNVERHLTFGFEVVDRHGTTWRGRSFNSSVRSSDQLSSTVVASGTLGSAGRLAFKVKLTDFRDQGLVRLDFCLHNPRRAEHAGGFWDLGDPGSELLQRATVNIKTGLPESGGVTWIEQPGCSVQHARSEAWAIGPQQRNALKSDASTSGSRQKPIRRDAPVYQVVCGDSHCVGTRPRPIVGLTSTNTGVSVAIEDFWEKGPTSIEIDRSTIKVHLLAEESDGCHELQAGETFSRTIWLKHFDGPAGVEDLAWVYQPLVARPTNTQLAMSGCLEWFTEQALAPDYPSHQLTQEMIDGPTNFFAKREAIDEYGWRNFGDMWADHEEAYATQPKPIISHYNNQYDLLHGLLRRFLVTGDPRWWQLAAPLARHIMDIDIYHTQDDKPAYNGGLFWHTAHYLDAGRSTHRSYSRDMLGQKYTVQGGGPAQEHNFTTGLLLYYHLTGDPRAKEAVLSLANWVVALDDGNLHVLAPFSSARTGTATCTASVGYHGPGRGAGNSINALIDAWQLTFDEKYLEKCRELIHRVVHPEDDVAALDLLNAEMRWSYTVALQSLARYEVIVGKHDPQTCRYIRASLVPYGRWMMQHERLYLDHPEELEFPTETWAAQDLRKGTSLMLIARYLKQGDERSAMNRRGEEILKAAWKQLMAHETRCCTRPAAIALQQLSIEEFLFATAHELASEPDRIGCEDVHWPPRVPFRTQKAEIMERLRSPLGIVMLACLALRPAPWLRSIPQTPLGTWYRRIGRLLTNK